MRGYYYMLDDKRKDLSEYRMNDALSTLQTSKLLYENSSYKDSINRCYYAAFYAIKAVLALEGVDFKRHKDAVGYFNQKYVATGIFSREIGKRLGRLKRVRETSDYDDFYIASKSEAEEQLESAQLIIEAIKKYLDNN